MYKKDWIEKHRPISLLGGRCARHACPYHQSREHGWPSSWHQCAPQPERAKQTDHVGLHLHDGYPGHISSVGALRYGFFRHLHPGIRIAGGLVTSFLGFRMLFPDDGKITREEKQEALQKSHISFSPLAMPSLSGPGAIAALITVSSSINGRHGIDRVFTYTNFFASWPWNRRSLSMPMKFEIRKLMFSTLCGRFPMARFTSAPYAGKECRSISARANASPGSLRERPSSSVRCRIGRSRQSPTAIGTPLDLSCRSSPRKES